MTDYVGYLLTIYPDLMADGMVPAGFPTSPSVEFNQLTGQLTIDGQTESAWLTSMGV